MTFGDLLAKVFEFIWDFWPLRIVHEWEQGIRLRSGRITATLGAGIHMFWPVVGEIITADCVTDVNSTDTQTCATGDDENVSFSLALKYRIVDLAAMYRSIQDPEDTIATEVCAAAAGIVATEEYDLLATTLGDLVWADINERLLKWGIELESCDVYTFTQCRTFRLINGD